jgi:SAM-dependent methyltransferase
METPPAHEPVYATGMAHHFRAVDPHGAVAASKAGFYAQALVYLNSRIRRQSRTLLDVGCGFGYFLERAAADGWQSVGVDIVPEAVSAARERVPSARLFATDLRGAGLASGSLEAITMWDLLDMVPDPAAELAECRRVLAPGGIIGIRVRNVASQLYLCRCFSRRSQLWRKLGIKPLHVFHRYNFTPRSIEQLLVRQGFENLVIQNSPLTAGDPYQYFSLGAAVGLGKSLAEALAGFTYRLTHGRWVIGPSLLVWAKKP